ncbi:hypothetical protein L1O48_06055 [Ligilactobacillus equi]|uniref:hypothetical protein n=1 Tax=Ligilactobacillus equi TaxID=137357 RepID=UPI002ED4F59B
MKNKSLALFLMGMTTIGISGIKVQADAASEVNNDGLTTDVNETSVSQENDNEKDKVAATTLLNTYLGGNLN